MSLFQVGRLAVKLAGRDAGRKCVIVEIIDDNFAVIDGDVRRKKVNLRHLEPLTQTVDLKDKASHDEVKKAFEKLELPVWEKKSKSPAKRVKKTKKVKAKPATEKKVKKESKKEEKTVEKKKAVETKEVPKTEEKAVEKPVEEKSAEKKE